MRLRRTAISGTVNIDVAAAVEAWYADPSANQGWVFYQQGSAHVGAFVASEDSVDVTQRPTLTIEYTHIPEPMTMVLLGAGLLPLLRRRRTRA